MNGEISWEDICTPEELRQVENAVSRIKDAASTIAFNERVIHSFAVRLAMRCAKAARDGDGIRSATMESDLVTRIHAICHAFGALKGSSGDQGEAMEVLSDRIIEAERATRKLCAPQETPSE